MNLLPSYKITAEAGSPEAEIMIYDVIGEETDFWSGEKSGISSTAFIADLKKVEETHDLIRIKINSLGGYVDEGLAIFNAIHYSKKEIHVHNDAVAYSFAAILMQAVPKGRRHSKKGAMLMLHASASYPFGRGRFTAAAATEYAAELTKYDKLVSAIIAPGIGMSSDEVYAKYFEDGKDYYFTPEEALAEGLIDQIEEKEAVEAISDFKIEQFNNHRIAALAGSNSVQLRDVKSESLLDIKTMFQKLLNKVNSFSINPSPNHNEMTLEKLAAKFKGEEVTITADESKEFKALLEKFSTAKFTQEEVDATVEEKVNAVKEELTTHNSQLKTQVEDIQAKFDKATGSAGAAGQQDDIDEPDEVQDDPVTAAAKAAKAEQEKNYSFLKSR